MSTGRSTPRWQRIVVWTCGIVGFFTILGWLTNRHSYEIKIETEGIDDSTPPMFVVATKYWGISTTQFPLRFSKEGNWEYKRNGRWDSVEGTEMESNIAVNYVPDVPDRPEF